MLQNGILSISKIFSFNDMIVMIVIIFFFKRWRGVEGEGKRESQANSIPSSEPDIGLGLTTLRS